MILNAYSLLDSKVGTFGAPFFMLHRGQAVRAVIEAAQDARTIVGRYPSDFVLYEIGTFDDVTGVLEAQRPESLGTVVHFLPEQPKLPLEERRPE